MSNTNPFNSPIVGILLQNSDASVSVDIFQRNIECEYHRLELTESMFDPYPTGVLVVRDKSDLISRMNTFGVIYIKFLFENNNFLNVKIHSISNVNNAASETEESYIALHFSNYLYTFCQENSVAQILQITKPKVFRIDQFVQTVAQKIGSIATQGTLTLDEANNYILYRPLNPNMEGTEIPSDDIIKYLNYITNYAVPLENGPYSSWKDYPRFVFWTNWGSYMNFKFLSSVVADTTALTKLDTFNLRYAIYSGEVPNQQIDGKFYKKIYNYATNQGNQYWTKQYYYVRKTPKVLDDPLMDKGNPYASTPGGNNYGRLAYQFLPEGEKFNTTVVSTGTAQNGYQAGAVELVYNGNWGYVDESHSSNENSPSTEMNRKYNSDQSYYNMNQANTGTGYFNYIDNSEMWKNIFDLTPLDPFYPETKIGQINTDSSNLQKVIDIRHNTLLKQYQNDLTTSQSALIRHQELVNFIAYTLCCMGADENESGFFAVLTQVSATTPGGNIYKYGWNKIVFAPTTGSSGDPTDFVGGGWTFDAFEKWDLNDDAPNVTSKAAINLNESKNKTSNPAYLGPGWVIPPSGFQYRFIGYGQTSSGGGINTLTSKPVVKIYKKSVAKLLQESGYDFKTNPLALTNQDIYSYLYYFEKENVVDGVCT